jgi:glycosyltransferase involved in cell wall biosynthesis
VRNQGIALASGDFVAHLDDDNLFEDNHISTLLQAFTRQPQAVLAFSYRQLLINGKTPFNHPYHPWSSDLEEATRVYETYERMGIYRRDSHLMRDRITFHEERNCTLDTNELLVRREIHHLFPFVENFSASMREAELGEDDIFCEQVYRAGLRIVASGEFTLKFTVGGHFTKTILNAIQ